MPEAAHRHRIHQLVDGIVEAAGDDAGRHHVAHRRVERSCAAPRDGLHDIAFRHDAENFPVLHHHDRADAALAEQDRNLAQCRGGTHRHHIGALGLQNRGNIHGVSSQLGRSVCTGEIGPRRHSPPAAPATASEGNDATFRRSGQAQAHKRRDSALVVPTSTAPFDFLPPRPIIGACPTESPRRPALPFR